jgi:glycosyltransferase involved in cell wall biosynthesis
MLMGPDTGSVAPIDVEAVQLFRGVTYPTHPDVKIGMPADLAKMFVRPPIDLVHSQTNTPMGHYARWLRRMWGIPAIHTHTVHLPTHSHFVLSDWLYRNDLVRNLARRGAEDLEHACAALYNDSDCLVVQSRFFVDYWRERGVTVPIEVVGRPIDPQKFSRQPGADPFPRHFAMGRRLLVICRHDREKGLDHLIRIFATQIAPHDRSATLTLVGDGHEHKSLMLQACQTAVADRIHFAGEVAHGTLVDWYAHADVFVYTSLSETFGNVVNEALWCGLPVVALDDRMGVAQQMADTVNGFLVEPGRSDTDARFAERCRQLLGSRELRRAMGEEAANLARMNAHPEVVLGRHEKIYAEAREHCRREIPTPLAAGGRLAQMSGFAGIIGRWTVQAGMFLGLAYAATRVGASRKSGALQHADGMRAVEEARTARAAVAEVATAAA